METMGTHRVLLCLAVLCLAVLAGCGLQPAGADEWFACEADGFSLDYPPGSWHCHVIDTNAVGVRAYSDGANLLLTVERTDSQGWEVQLLEAWLAELGAGGGPQNLELGQQYSMVWLDGNSHAGRGFNATDPDTGARLAGYATLARTEDGRVWKAIVVAPEAGWVERWRVFARMFRSIREEE